MTSRKVMAARIGPASLRSGPRSVYVFVPETNGQDRQAQIDTVLGKFIRPADHLVYTDANPDAVIAFAERYGVLTDPIELESEGSQPDLVIVIIDPLADNTDTLTSPARIMARYQRADLVITELPDHID